MENREVKLLYALFDVAEENINYLSFEGQEKWNKLCKKQEEENII